jgi:tRNA-specific 2-thiouridylase
MKRVVVAMSGGIDSSFSALWLKLQGYEVIGVTFRFLKEVRCCEIDKAIVVAKLLDIPHFVIELTNEFEKRVIKPFIEGYRQGLTPNPCAICNRDIKFGLVMDLAMKEAKADLYATGHYARLSTYKGYPVLTQPKNQKKDQTYFLALVKKERLAKLIFPIGDVPEKRVALEALKSYGLDLWQKAEESQDVCFLKGLDLKSYLSKYLPKIEGEIIYQEKVVGKHEGYYFYTIGQRQGLGIRMGKPLYVARISPEENRIYLGNKDEIFSDRLVLSQTNFHLPFELWETPLAQVRYRSSRAAVAKVERQDDKVLVELKQKVFAITPGQVCAFYEREYLLGGGIISSSS